MLNKLFNQISSNEISLCVVISNSAVMWIIQNNLKAYNNCYFSVSSSLNSITAEPTLLMATVVHVDSQLYLDLNGCSDSIQLQ